MTDNFCIPSSDFDPNIHELIAKHSNSQECDAGCLPNPTASPTASPTPSPTPNPTANPTPNPTPNPTATPTPTPTAYQAIYFRSSRPDLKINW